MAGAVVVIDYGSGNLRSAAKALEHTAAAAGNGWTVTVSAEAQALNAAERIVLPGVGAFADCMAGLRALPGMIEALTENVIRRGKPFLGICVGMQLMARRGIEHGVHDGLGWIDGEVGPITPADPMLKVPHMGWNGLEMANGGAAHPLLDGIAPGSHAYFVHSYAMTCARDGDTLARVDYGGPISAVVGRDNLVGTQFHPEKSQAVGLHILGNFLRWRP